MFAEEILDDGAAAFRGFVRPALLLRQDAGGDETKRPRIQLRSKFFRAQPDDAIDWLRRRRLGMTSSTCYRQAKYKC